MDKLSKQQRHANMAAIRSKDAKPEMIVRRGLSPPSSSLRPMADGQSSSEQVNTIS